MDIRSVTGDALLTIVGVTTDWVQGADSVAGVYKFGHGNIPSGITGVNLFMQCTTAGAFTMPNQPAFLAYATGAQNSVTGNQTLYTVLFATEVFDQGSNFAASTFTAPVTGRYRLEACVGFNGIASTNTQGQCIIAASNRSCVNECSSPYAIRNSTGYVGYTISCLIDMDAADTAVVQFLVGPGTGAKGINILVDATTLYTYFSGNLEC
jgi:hypothetical protein